MTALFSATEFSTLTEVQRRSVLAALFVVAGVDGQMDGQELAVARPFLEATAAVQLGPVQAEARAVRTPQDVFALGKRCADALPDMAARERLVSLLLAVAWADGAVLAQEFSVLGAFMQGIGLPGERANELADASAEGSIFGAVSRGKLEAVRRLLDGGVPVMSRDPKQWTPLHVAVATGQAAIVDLLLDRGADVHARHSQGSPPLFLACNKPYAAVVERLLRAGAKANEAGAAGVTPVIIAASFGQTAVLRALRRAGASLEVTDAAGRTPLHCAAEEGRVATVAFLLAEGAPANARTPKACTPLMSGAERGDLATMAALLAAKADVDATDASGQTALHYAVAGNAPDVVEMLLAFGANPSASSQNKTTPLHVAAAAGFTACARLLLDAGADRDAANVEGGTPIFLAAIRDRREVHDLLVARGATPDPSKIGAALAVKSLRAAPLAEAPPTPPALRPSDAALATFDDYQVAAWMNVEGTPDQVLVAGKDAKGRPEWVGRTGAGDARARFLVVKDKAGKRWLPVFSSEAAATAFRGRTPVGWPEDGTGMAAAAIGSSAAGVGVFKLGELPVDGVVLNPYGPSGPVFLTADECDRITRWPSRR